MITWSADEVAHAAVARLLAPGPGDRGPQRVTIDSREAGPGALFVGLPGERFDGGAFAGHALAAGAWGVLVTPEHAAHVPNTQMGAVLVAPDPLGALQRMATAWRRALGAAVIGVTGSTGKTSTKELILAVLAGRRRAVGSRANFNTEIGLPLEVLATPVGTEVLVLEMAMRGAGQIAELAMIAEPDVGVIVNVGPAHIELLGSLEAIAAAKAELIAALAPGSVAITPADEPLLAPHRRADLRNVTFGDGGDVRLRSESGEHVEIDVGSRRITLELDFSQTHLRHDLLAAVAAADAVGVLAAGRVSLEPGRGRGRQLRLPGAITLIDDSYNANPMSMRAALDELAAVAARRPGSRPVAVLGDMLELGPRAREYHLEVGAHTARVGVSLLVSVGELGKLIGEGFGGDRHHAEDAQRAVSVLLSLLAPGDVVLVKGSRGIRLEQVCAALTDEVPA